MFKRLFGENGLHKELDEESKIEAKIVSEFSETKNSEALEKMAEDKCNQDEN